MSNKIIMNISDEILLNQLSLKIIPLKVGIDWFSRKPKEQQDEIINVLISFIKQSDAFSSDAEGAIIDSGLKYTYVPCQLLLASARNEPIGNKKLIECLYKIKTLPDKEKHKSFILLLSLLGIGLHRRKQRVQDPERLWWLRDLSDKNVVKEIINSSRAC